MPIIWLWIFVILGAGFVLYRGFIKYNEKKSKGNDFAPLSSPDSEEDELANIQSGVCGQLYERDIFYRFMQNHHFSGLIKSLYSKAAENREIECHQIVAEILQYQKHFKESDILMALKKADKENNYEKIVQLLHPYAQ